jgi:STE24 endopeptidase
MASTLSLIFVVVLLATVSLKYWLAWRQIRHVRANADRVPSQFAERISLAAHQKAAAYTVAKQRFGMIDTAGSTAVLLLLTLLGGLQWISDGLTAWFGAALLHDIAVVVAVIVLLGAIDLPFSWYRQFHIEQAFGFNRMTPALFVTDLAKSVLLSALIGLPLLALVLWLMQSAGAVWWLYAWGVWVGFNLLLLVLYPTLIAPLFNKFEPLADAALAERITGLLARTGFSSRGVFVMDGSRRSAHGNAYFTGMGRAKRIVFFDTLVERLKPAEIEAVLAHELGHFKRRHVTKRLAFTFFASGAFLALLAWLAQQVWFYQGLGVEPLLSGSSNGVALVLFMLVAPVFTFVLAPLAGRISRKHEFEADAFAVQTTAGADLASALVKLYEDNASTLTPDPVHSAFYDSHPPAAVRIARLNPASAPA